jgi:hypothetical protein
LFRKKSKDGTGNKAIFSFLKIVLPPGGRPKAGGICSSGAGRDHPVVMQPMDLSSTHGEEAGRVLALLQWLLPAQQHHGPWHLPLAGHDELLF